MNAREEARALVLGHALEIAVALEADPVGLVQFTALDPSEELVQVLECLRDLQHFLLGHESSDRFSSGGRACLAVSRRRRQVRKMRSRALPDIS